MLTSDNPTVNYDLGAMRLLYSRCPRTSIVEFSCLPVAMAGSVVPPRPFDTGPHIDNLPAFRLPRYAQEPEWLTPVKTAASPLVHEFTLNRSMRSNRDMRELRFDSHAASDTPAGGKQIETVILSAQGLRLVHRVRWNPGDPFFSVSVEAVNTGPASTTLEYLPSFSLGGITPFEAGEGTERLRLHRFRAVWSGEGRHEARLLEELNLERSWNGYGRRTERFGQSGSLPVRVWFPWAALEDTVAGVFWGVQLAAPGSWHLEVTRRKDKVSLSGGLPSRDFGEWWLTLEPGESFTTPEAVLSCVSGDIDDLCHALTEAQRPAASDHATGSGPLPIIFNEWCSSWGAPTHEYVASTARALAEHKLADILVIDDGWAQRPPDSGIQNNGDWVVDTRKFPEGLAATAAEIRKVGLVPGLWFEYEAATEGSEAFGREACHLHRDGRPLQVGSRRFWDLRNPEAEDYLAGKVIARLRDDGFGYWKIDYNECLPAGVDGPGSPGENLRQHLLAVQGFVERIRREVPGILIENCSSGGSRIEPSFQAISTLAQFSDSHETVAIPIIAANLHRLVLAQQLQVWCVVHAKDTLQRLRYSLSVGPLGVLCLSGDIKDLPPSHLAEIAAARDFHREASAVIRDGRSRIFRELSLSWNEPRGWQAVVRSTSDRAVVVVHTFGGPLPETLKVPLTGGNWAVQHVLGGGDAACETDVFTVPVCGDFCGHAFLLVRQDTSRKAQSTRK